MYPELTMTMFAIISIAIALAMDAFAVSLAAGVVLKECTPRHYFRLSFHFGLFQFLMPVLGWYAGKLILNMIADYDHWVVFGLLVFIGGKMLFESFRPVGKSNLADPTRGISLVIFSIATSLDALAVGISLAFLKITIWFPAAIIGVVAALASMLGLRIGNLAGRAVGRWAERLGGVILIGIGTKVLVEHIGWG